MKKMDSVFTPYNGMFAFVNTKPNKTTTIAIKLDNKLVPYSNYLWWKKDFLENAIAFYSRYVLNARQVALKEYIKQKPFSNYQKEFLYKRLTPDSVLVKSFPRWLEDYVGKERNNYSMMEFVKYDFDFSDSKLLLTDSTSLFKIKVSNGEFVY